MISLSDLREVLTPGVFREMHKNAGLGAVAPEQLAALNTAYAQALAAQDYTSAAQYEALINQVSGSTAADPVPSASGDAGGFLADAAALFRGLLSTPAASAAAGAAVTGAFGGKPATTLPKPAPPSAPWTTGEKVAAGLAAAGTVGTIAYLVTRKPSRRRRR